MTRQELCAALDAQLAAAQEQVCVLAVPLAGGVPLYERGAGRRAVSASTIKVFILLAALDEVRRGRLALDTPVSVTAEDILPDTGVFVDGPGMHPLEELLVWMIVLSDNTATNVLIGLLGAECINAAACSVGTKNTVLERKMLDWDAVSAGRNNYTSAEDLLRVFAALDDEDTVYTLLEDLFTIREIKETYPDQVVMADIATINDARHSVEAGADIISTTLSGYTEDSLDRYALGTDFDLIEQIRKEFPEVFINAEGRIWTREEAKKAFECGADVIVVGTAITNPMSITKRFVDYIKK